MNSMTRSLLRFGSCAALALLAASCARTPPGAFEDPADAVKAVDALIGTGDEAGFDRLFGPGSMEMLQSGDPVADKSDGEKVKALIAEKIAFEDIDATTKVALLGNDDWPFPVPLVREGEHWRFDAIKGREEIANRRVGRNELHVLASLHALVDAQREYEAASRDGLPRQFARRFRSTDGKQDGLYWPAAEGEPESPLGDLMAEASGGGYDLTAGEPQPYHGYRFRMLDAQGASAPGGAKSYVDAAGNMTGGFACIAWPAKHGMSGIMTFMVGKHGIVFQKDLGEGTDAAVAAITAFDPDDSWTTTYDPDDVPAEQAAIDGGPTPPGN